MLFNRNILARWLYNIQCDVKIVVQWTVTNLTEDGDVFQVSPKLTIINHH
jgi:hypothetical protein